jgi:hypothetical protein
MQLRPLFQRLTLVLTSALLGACEAPPPINDAACAAMCPGGLCLDISTNMSPALPVIIDSTSSRVTNNPAYGGAQCCPANQATANLSIEKRIEACVKAMMIDGSQVIRYQAIPEGYTPGSDCTTMGCPNMGEICNPDTKMCVKPGFDCRKTDKCSGNMVCDPADGMCKTQPQPDACSTTKACPEAESCVLCMPNACVMSCKGANGPDVNGVPAGGLGNPRCGNGGAGNVNGLCKPKTLQVRCACRAPRIW